MKILCFGASTHSRSINQKLALYTATFFKKATIITIDLNHYEMPIYSEDRQRDTGIPEQAHKFRSLLQEADGVIISFAEHNGVYTAAFKNVMDWNSVIGGKTWEDKSYFLMATSPGPRGGATVLDIACDKWPYMGADIKARFSLPSFPNNFDYEKGILDPDLKSTHLAQIEAFKKAINY